MAKRIKGNGNVERVVNETDAEVDGVEVVSEEDVEAFFKYDSDKANATTDGKTRDFDTIPWEERRLIIPAIEREIETPSGGTARLAVEVREGVRSFSPKLKFGRRNAQGRINSGEIWMQDMEYLLPMILAAIEQSRGVLLSEEEKRANERRARLTRSFTFQDLMSSASSILAATK